MSADIMSHAVDVAGRLRDTQRRRPFEHAAAEFVQLLSGVPDCAAHEMSDGEVGALQTIAEGVIGRIETRIDSEVDPAADREALAGTVYEIRRLLEEVDMWRRHYDMRRSS